jgi:hypothetical protein
MRGKKYQKDENILIIDISLLENLLKYIEHGHHIFHYFGIKPWSIAQAFVVV